MVWVTIYKRFLLVCYYLCVMYGAWAIFEGINDFLYSLRVCCVHKYWLMWYCDIDDVYFPYYRLWDCHWNDVEFGHSDFYLTHEVFIKWTVLNPNFSFATLFSISFVKSSLMAIPGCFKSRLFLNVKFLSYSFENFMKTNLFLLFWGFPILCINIGCVFISNCSKTISFITLFIFSLAVSFEPHTLGGCISCSSIQNDLFLKLEFRFILISFSLALILWFVDLFHL